MTRARRDIECEAVEVAKLAQLRYVSCRDAGIRRVKRGSGFVYVLPNGCLLRDSYRLEAIRHVALPPAWRDVWICMDPHGHLLATGFDARGRKQYRYHPKWRKVRDGVKYHELESFGRNLPRLRRRVAADLASRGLTKRKVLATVISVMSRTGLRVGNDRYAEENGSYGLTTLLDRHARFDGTSVEFAFRGKGGKAYQVRVPDRRLAAIVKRCRDIPGQQLFQYLDSWGSHQSITSTDVNRYLKEAMGGDYSAKTFRTWIATLLSLVLFAELTPGKSKPQLARQVNQVLRVVAGQLGNTPAICRKSYVDPRVVDGFVSGALASSLKRIPPIAGLKQSERALVGLLSTTPEIASAA